MPIYLADVSASPNPAGLPGSNVLQQLVNGVDAWALAITLVGAFVGAAHVGGRVAHEQPSLRGDAAAWRRSCRPARHWSSEPPRASSTSSRTWERRPSERDQRT